METSRRLSRAGSYTCQVLGHQTLLVCCCLGSAIHRGRTASSSRSLCCTKPGACEDEQQNVLHQSQSAHLGGWSQLLVVCRYMFTFSHMKIAEGLAWWGHNLYAKQCRNRLTAYQDQLLHAGCQAGQHMSFQHFCSLFNQHNLDIQIAHKRLQSGSACTQ